MRNKIKLHIQLTILAFTASAILIVAYGVFIYTIDKQEQLREIDNHYMTLLENYNSNLGTIQDYHKNHQAILVFDKKAKQIIRNLFIDSKLGEKIYPFVMDSKGELIIHPYSEGANVSQSFWGAKILNSQKNSGNFSFFSKEYKVHNKLYFATNPNFDVVFGIIGEEDIIYNDFNFNRRMIIGSTLVLILVIGLIVFQTSQKMLVPLKELYIRLNKLSQGNWNVSLQNNSSKEFALISKAFNATAESISKTTQYALNISESKSEENESIKLDDNTLNEILLKIEKNISDAIQVEEQRKVDDEKLNWFNKGIAKFGEVLRLNTSSMEELADNIIQNLVKYVGANQGGIFSVNSDNPDNEYLELISAFAFDSKKYLEKKIAIGEGLVGTCAIEKQTVYIKQAPESYIEITSGLGDASPRSILIVPVKLEDKVLGVIELASFSYFEKHQIQFIEKIMESVAATLSSSRINQQTKELLEKFEVQSKEMAEQEEEMRQNIEELTATQEEASAREAELNSIIQAITSNINYLEFDSEYRISNINENFTNLFDLQYEATFGKSLNDLILIKKAKFADTNAALKSLQEGEEIEEIQEYTVNGQSFKVKDSYKPVKKSYGDITKIIRITTVID